jgi:hypothetical protein
MSLVSGNAGFALPAFSGMIAIVAISAAIPSPAFAQAGGEAQQTSHVSSPKALVNPPPALTAETFAGLFEACRPKADQERWTEIPWIGELWEGRQKAAREQKPLFIWAMNGHPLGCV